MNQRMYMLPLGMCKKNKQILSMYRLSNKDIDYPCWKNFWDYYYYIEFILNS